jgi:hypothetical protein
METKIVATSRDYTRWDGEVKGWCAICSINTKGPYCMSEERVEEILHEYVDSSMRVNWFIDCSYESLIGANWRVYISVDHIKTKEIFCKVKKAFHAIEKEILKAR